MAIDMKKMRERMSSLKNKGNGNSNKFWRPQDGDQTIRIVPPEDGDPFKDYWFHYNLKDASGNDVPGFLSPKRNFGENCPLDSFVRQLWQEGSEESRKQAKTLSARQRFFAPVIVRGEEDMGVRLWGFGKTAYETLLNLVLNPEYGDITDPETGTDLKLTYGKPAGASFPQTKIVPRRRSSPMHDSSDRCRELLESVPDFDEVFATSRKTTAEVQAILDEYLLSGDDAEENSTETTHINAKSSDTGNLVDDTFAELLAS